MARFPVLPAVFALLSVGCVAKQKYLDLEGSLAGTRQDLSAREARIAELEAALAAEKDELRGLEARIASLQQDLERRQQALAESQAKEAELIASKGRLQGDVEAMRQALAELQARKEAAERRLAAYRDLLSRFQKLIDAGRLRVKIVDGRMVVELATDVLFASGSADLSPEGKAAIDEVAGVLATIPGRSFQVEGHTDDDPIHTALYPSNWELAAGRALTVTRAMIAAGMPPARVSAASFGETRPVAPNDAKESKARNRRIEIVVVPDLSDLPGYDELQKVGGEAR